MIRSATRSTLGLAGVAGLVGLGLALSPALSPATPASAEETCRTSDDRTSVTCTWSATGAEQAFVVPDGVTVLQASAVGGTGGRAVGAASAGRPVVVTGPLAVAPGQTLFVRVGGDGGDAVPAEPTLPAAGGAGGFNGGAPGGAAGPDGDELRTSGAGGGGASDVRTVSGDAEGSLDSRVLVAAGSGGASLSDGGWGDPTAWDTGTTATVLPTPEGADQTTVPAGDDLPAGTQDVQDAAAPTPPWEQWRAEGRYGQGSGGADADGGAGHGGGGGGGGLFGGAGGASWVAGTGGTSLVPPGGTADWTTGPASVTLTYAVPAETPADTSAPVEAPFAVQAPTPAEIPAGAPAVVPVAGPSPAGERVAVPAAQSPPPTGQVPSRVAGAPLTVDTAASGGPVGALDSDGAAVLAGVLLGGISVAVGVALVVAVRRPRS
ncbi:glycine-rich protein [Modestobacter sp. I12A-02662]|uniref:glycine-rich protein n=1 Tax=Modestobacter sp. I12A-02662 TaxID=1730496 RepID=UPI0034DE5850